MSAMASQITSFAIVYSTVYWRHISKKTSKLCVTGLCAGNSPVTCEFPALRASNAENVSIWWRHHGLKAGICTKLRLCCSLLFWIRGMICDQFLIMMIKKYSFDNHLSNDDTKMKAYIWRGQIPLIFFTQLNLSGISTLTFTDSCDFRDYVDFRRSPLQNL